MEWVIAILIVISMLWIGYLTASLFAVFSRYSSNRIGKLAIWIVAVFLPILLYAVIWVYNGVSKCSSCQSVTTNIQTRDPWITDVELCRKCVKYVDACQICAPNTGSQTDKRATPLEKSASARQVCLDCDGYIGMSDDELGETFVLVCLILINIGHLATLSVLGVIRLVENRKNIIRI